MENTPEVNGISPIVNIKVCGVGGGGNNAVNRMIEAKLRGVEFISINTDKQVLLVNKAKIRLQIGEKLTKGQGSGNDPSVGEKAAEESRPIITEILKGADLVFITAGMGGGTGTGAAPVIASVAKEMGIVTVAVVTKPFHFEGKKRMDNAERGIAELRKYVDTIIVVPNEKLLSVLPKNIGMLEAHRYADDVLRQGIAGISNIIINPSVINLDFADIRKIIKNKGKAHMGIGRAGGENKVIEAVKQAVSSPLLETSIEGATGLIIQVNGGIGVTLEECSTAATLVQGVVSDNCETIYGQGIDERLGSDIEITIIATGLKETEAEISKNQEYQRMNSLKQPAEKKPETNKEFVFENFEKNFVSGGELFAETKKEVAATTEKEVEPVKQEEKTEEIATATPFANKTRAGNVDEISKADLGLKVREIKNERIDIKTSNDDIPAFLRKLREKK